jgi:hypothetical protein
MAEGPLLPPSFSPTVSGDGGIPGLFKSAQQALNPTASPLVQLGPDYTDDKKLLDLASRLKSEAYDNRFIFERGWWRIMLYTLGRQWIYYDTQRGQWADKRMAKWIPRPVTNKIGETISSYRSVFQSVQLVAKCRPNGNDPKNVQTAEVADRLEPAIREEHDADAFFKEADFWFITLGNVFLHPWWNKNGAVGSTLLSFEQCLACSAVVAPDEIINGNMCPKCKTMGAFKPAVDQSGAPIGIQSAGGCGVTDVCSPFEIALPPGYMEFKDISHLIRSRWRTKQYCEANWGDAAKKLKYDKMPVERSLQLLRSLATAADSSSSPLQYALGGTTSTQADGITEYELHLKPCRDYPDGMLLRWAGDSAPTVVRVENQSLPGPLPYHDSKGNPLFPWLHAGYEHMGGRIWARSPLEPGLSKQDQLNQLDSLTQLIVQRTANPIWLEPKGAEVKKFTGEPGLVVKYNPMIGGGNAKPERIAGENIPITVIQLRQQILTDIENLMGTSDILKGQRPPNIEAFSALQLLVERSQSRFGPALGERGKLYRGWYTLALELEREFGPAERIYAVLGPNQSWTFENFQKADLSGEIQVLIEDGSQTPKTSLGKRAAIEQLNQLGFLDKNDAEQRYTILKAFGQTDLLPSLDNDVKSALQEQDAFERWSMDEMASAPVMPMLPPTLPGAMDAGTAGMGSQEPVPPVEASAAPGMTPPAESPADVPAGQGGASTGMAPQGPPAPQLVAPMAQPGQYATPMPMMVQYWNRDDVHNAEHRKWANSDNARKLFEARPELVPDFTNHMQMHDLSAMMKAMQQAQMQSGQMPGGGAQGVGQALERSNKESGRPGDVPSGQSERGQGRGPE